MPRFPLWKYALVAAVLVVASVYALPSGYAKLPIVQVRAAASGAPVNAATLDAVREALEKAGLAADSVSLQDGTVEAVFTEAETQIGARGIIAEALGGDYVAAYNTATSAPPWLRAMGAKPLALGLDLRGGVYFLLQVDVDFAVRKRLRGIAAEIERTVDGSSAEILEDGALAVKLAGGEDEALAKIREQFPSLALEEDEKPGLRFVFGASALDEIVDLTMQQNLQTLRNRVDELGVAEPVITRQGRDRIAAQLPGVQDTAQAKKILGRTAALELRGVDETKSASRAIIRRAKRGRNPPGGELFYETDGTPLILEKTPVITGENITDARPGYDQNNQPAVHIALDAAGGEKMKRHTRPRVGRQLAILLRDKNTSEIISAPVVREELYVNFQISGRMNSSEAAELALLLRSGSLAAPLEIVEERTVGPSLGADNIRRGVNSVIGGFAAIAIFIAVYYAAFGLISVGALLANVLMLTALLAVAGATLTLPGLAGFALTLGMAIDANVLINERIREESDAGKTPLGAIQTGYQRAFTTIVDSNITTLIAGLALFAFGSGPVRGFAVVLCFGILTSMFSAVQGSRALVNFSFERRRVKKLNLGMRMLNLKKTLPLMKFRAYTGVLSAAFLLVCVISLAVRGLNFGVDFTGGTVVETSFEKTPPIAAVRESMAKIGLEDAPLQQSGDGLLIIKAPPGESGAELSTRVMDALREIAPGAELRRLEYVGAQVGGELFWAGLLALIFVVAGIMMYLSFRFKWRMAVGAIIANLHDVIFILGLFSLFQLEFNLPVLAATLAILGYSVNESVVIFDRVRENYRTQRGSFSPADMLDLSITQTWARTVITHGSTQLAVCSMLFFGGDALFLFSLALTIGIFSSIYSSVLISGPIALRLGLEREDFMEKKTDPRAENAAGAVV
ncbi:MAG: protein translocase subunit SecD [Betaproteobacteria bacterium]|nr:protein translocase subunit SecD [Betaproteobacteria bacterium]